MSRQEEQVADKVPVCAVPSWALNKDSFVGLSSFARFVLPSSFSLNIAGSREAVRFFYVVVRMFGVMELSSSSFASSTRARLKLFDPRSGFKSSPARHFLPDKSPFFEGFVYMLVRSEWRFLSAIVLSLTGSDFWSATFLYTVRACWTAGRCGTGLSASLQAKSWSPRSC